MRSPAITLFDLDGTLTDSAPGIVTGFRHALATVGAPEPDVDLTQLILGPPMADTLRTVGLDDADAERALAAYFDRYDRIGWAENEVFPGVADLLTGLSASGSRLAVATSKSERFAVRILDHFGLSGHFEVVAGASADGTRRAKADVVEHALRGLGVSPVPGGTPDVVMVGDRVHDVHGAAHWGIPTVLVHWGYGAESEADDAAWSARTVGELGAILHAR
ncbi:Hydrolase [Rhodococcus sp. RD6.2]|uniref:HAD-IA family hydrolase n=1 Tax=Rhodococcus sp. RD6.2 TaxID=260936 RepID=UPI00063B7A04|nr:HAD-IA family hydrolase [Rhodococcus sp. RD6.2]CRK51776.1 Hydrolase [Rhodococcus sp. RD6.2]